MRDRVPDLAKAVVLLCNDDGIDAPGLGHLERIVAPLVAELWIAAPETEQSGAGHSLTLRRPLRIRHVSGRRYAVDGTPTDAALLGVNRIMKEQGRRPDLVLSGINRGGNLGEDVTYSGTIAAAMEATLLGYPAVALSLVTDAEGNARWSTAERWLPEVLKGLARLPWPEGVLMNVNFPDVAAETVSGIEITRQGRRKPGGEIVAGRDPRGDAYYWIGAQRQEDRHRKHTDLEAVLRGAIAVTPLSMDMTHAPMLKALREAFR
ncbi:MAG: 5'/3'-nucleotidase SurE [Magnetospirillum sp. WYHS-4]